jgi:NAD-dependent deacetylase
MPDGIWATVRIEDVATPEAFARDPVTVQAFYNARRRGLLDPAVVPTPRIARSPRSSARMATCWW